MNTVKISILSALLVLSQVAQGMNPGQIKPAAKPKSTATQMRDALKGARGTFGTNFNRTVEHATDGEGIGALVGLRQEGQGLVDDLYKAGGIVQDIAGDLTAPLEVGLELAEANLKKAGVQAKYKKQARDIIAEVRAVAPKLVTAGVVAYLIWTYMQLPAQQQVEAPLPQTKVQALKAWALNKCEPIIVKFGEAYGAAAGKAAAQQFVQDNAVVPKQVFAVNGNGPTVSTGYTQVPQAPQVPVQPQVGWGQWVANLMPRTI